MAGQYKMTVRELVEKLVEPGDQELLFRVPAQSEIRIGHPHDDKHIGITAVDGLQGSILYLEPTQVIHHRKS